MKRLLLPIPLVKHNHYTNWLIWPQISWVIVTHYVGYLSCRYFNQNFWVTVTHYLLLCIIYLWRAKLSLKLGKCQFGAKKVEYFGHVIGGGVIHLNPKKLSVEIGAVLTRKRPDDQEYPVAFASRKLRPREQNYSVVEKECLAIMWALQFFYPYFYGHHFVVETISH